MAVSIPQIWSYRTVTVAAGSTTVIDNVRKSYANSLEYHLDMRRGNNSQVKALKMLVTQQASDTQDTVFGQRGTANLDMVVQSQLNGSDIELQVTNNEAFDVNINLARAII